MSYPGWTCTLVHVIFESVAHTVTMVAEHNDFILDVTRYNTKGVPDRRDLLFN